MNIELRTHFPFLYLVSGSSCRCVTLCLVHLFKLLSTCQFIPNFEVLQHIKLNNNVFNWQMKMVILTGGTS